jgi:hypothetical protein
MHVPRESASRGDGGGGGRGGFLTPLASKAMSHRPHRTTRRTPTRDEERVALARLEGVRTSGTSIRIKTPSSDGQRDRRSGILQHVIGSSELFQSETSLLSGVAELIMRRENNNNFHSKSPSV